MNKNLHHVIVYSYKMKFMYLHTVHSTIKELYVKIVILNQK